ncbi:MAG: GNAT family protein [Bacteroidales bacterium]
MKIRFRDLTFEPWRMDHAADLAVIANNKNIAYNLRDRFPHPYSYEDAVSWLGMATKDNDPARLFAIIFEGKLAGSIGLIAKEDVYCKNAETGYFLAEHLWGKGIMTNAISAISTYAFSEFDIIRIYAEVFADNTGSRRALEKSGFRCEATISKNIFKGGEIRDSCIYSVLRENFHPVEISIES